MEKETMRRFVDQDVYEDILAGTNIIANDEFRTIMCTISQMCSDLVVKTLGPYGATTLLDDGQGFIYPTKDGWSALKKLNLRDPIYNSALNTLRNVSFSAVTGVGDGTTTAEVASNAFLQTILGSSIIEEKGFNQALFRQMVETAAEDVINELYRRTTPIEHNERGIADIKRIATIATNGNEKYGEMIADIYLKTENPDIHVRIGDTAETTYEIQEGYRVEANTLGFKAFVNTDSGRCVEKNARILIFNHNVTYIDDWDFLECVIRLCNEKRFKLVIMAPYFDEMVTNWYARNLQKSQSAGTVPLIMLCQIPNTTKLQQVALSDLEILTNASIIDGEKVAMFTHLSKYQRDPEHAAENRCDMRLVKAAEEVYEHPQAIIDSSIGVAGRLEFSQKEIYLLEYESYANLQKLKTAQEEAKQEWARVREKMNKVSGGNLDKDYMYAHQRYIRLIGKMGSIIVGGVSNLQKICDKDAIDDACLACRSAWDAGYVCGMNLDTLRVIRYELDNYWKMIETDQTGQQNQLNNRYYVFALESLFEAFKTVPEAVLRNKCGDDVRQQIGFDDGSFAYLYNKTILNLLILGQTVWTKEEGDALHVNGEVSSKDDDEFIEIRADVTGDGRYSYDLRNNMMHTMNHPEAIINSVNMDVEIIRSMVSVLTMVITSSQFLSTGKMYDRKLTKSQERQRLVDETTTKGQAFMQGILNSLQDPNNKGAVETLQSVLNGISWQTLSVGIEGETDAIKPCQGDHCGHQCAPAAVKTGEVHTCNRGKGYTTGYVAPWGFETETHRDLVNEDGEELSE